MHTMKFMCLVAAIRKAVVGQRLLVIERADGEVARAFAAEGYDVHVLHDDVQKLPHSDASEDTVITMHQISGPDGDSIRKEAQRVARSKVIHVVRPTDVRKSEDYVVTADGSYSLLIQDLGATPKKEHARIRKVIADDQCVEHVTQWAREYESRRCDFAVIGIPEGLRVVVSKRDETVNILFDEPGVSPRDRSKQFPDLRDQLSSIPEQFVAHGYLVGIPKGPRMDHEGLRMDKHELAFMSKDVILRKEFKTEDGRDARMALIFTDFVAGDPRENPWIERHCQMRKMVDAAGDMLFYVEAAVEKSGMDAVQRAVSICKTPGFQGAFVTYTESQWNSPQGIIEVTKGVTFKAMVTRQAPAGPGSYVYGFGVRDDTGEIHEFGETTPMQMNLAPGEVVAVTTDLVVAYQDEDEAWRIRTGPMMLGNKVGGPPNQFYDIIRMAYENGTLQAPKENKSELLAGIGVEVKQ